MNENVIRGYIREHKSVDDAWSAYNEDYPGNRVSRKEFRRVAAGNAPASNYPVKLFTSIPPDKERQDDEDLDRILMIPDAHIPFEDKKAYDVMIRAARAWKPHRIVIIGDYADFFQVSFHPKDMRGKDSFPDEVAAVNRRLDELDDLGALRKHYVAGNHEARLQRYIENNAGALNGLPGLSVPELFRLEERGWEYTKYQDSIRIGKAYFTHDEGNGSSGAHMKARDTFGSNAVIGHCLPIDCEVSTRRGFVKLSDVTLDDVVLAYSDGKVVESPVRRVIRYKYTGEMASFDNNVISQTMTKDHHLFTKDGRYLPLTDAVKSVTKADLVTSALPNNDYEDYPVSDDMLRLVVAYCADGYHASANSIRWHIKKPRKIARLTELVTNLGGNIEWSEPSATGSFKTKKLSKPLQHEIVRLCPNKLLPEWLLKLSARQRQIVIDELALWDGSIIMIRGIDYGCRQFFSSKLADADLVQRLLLQHGILSTVHLRDTGVRTICYNVFEKEPGANLPLEKFVSWANVEDVDVGCITTDYNNFFVRLPSGKIELTGNCHALNVSYQGNAAGEVHIGFSLGWLGSLDEISYMHKVKAQKWVHGFGIGYHEVDTGMVWMQAIPIVDGRCCLNGQIIR